jgi:hypothetical protein
LWRYYYLLLGKTEFDASITTFWLFCQPGKGKGHPKPAMKALDKGGWSTPRSGRFTPGTVSVPIVQEAGWTQGRSTRVGKISPPPGFDLQTVYSVVSR